VARLSSAAAIVDKSSMENNGRLAKPAQLLHYCFQPMFFGCTIMLFSRFFFYFYFSYPSPTAVEKR
jgi:hypothetical protein